MVLLSVACLIKFMAKKTLPRYLSSDNDPLFKFHRFQANLRILDIHEIKTLPHVPLSHPFIERLIGTIRRECLDKLFFWNQRDLENKLNEFKNYYNNFRAHSSLDSFTPAENYEGEKNKIISIKKYAWKSHCKNLASLPVAA